MKTREIRQYKVLDKTMIYLYENVHVGTTYSAKVCTNKSIRYKKGFRSSVSARKWAEKTAKELERNNL